MDHPVQRALLLFWRATRLRCPNCGGGLIFRSWFRMRAHCPSCGLPLERDEQGYQVGSYMFNIIAAELIFVLVFLGVVLATWPSPPWRLLQYGGIILMILAPVIFFPFSRDSLPGLRPALPSGYTGRTVLISIRIRQRLFA